MLPHLRFRVEASRGRRYPEPEHRYRNAFQRDRDRVIHARAFRRLENKTQVFSPEISDHFRNRLTHTLEVSQIARTVASVLEVDEDLTEALALAHDTAGEIAKLKGRIGHVHLSDCNGKVHGDLPPGRGTVDFPPYLKALADAGFAGTVSIELEYSPEPGKIVDWVREAYTATDRLMQDLAIRN